MNLTFFALLFLFSFNLRADYLCKDFLVSSQLDSSEERLSESVKRLIQIRFGNINMNSVKSYGVVSLPADLNVFERMGTSFIVVINELEFEDGESLKTFLDILYDKVRDPGLIIIERIPQGLKETFTSVFSSGVNKGNAFFSMYFNPMSDVVIDVISSGDYYSPESIAFEGGLEEVEQEELSSSTEIEERKAPPINERPFAGGPLLITRETEPLQGRSIRKQVAVAPVVSRVEPSTKKQESRDNSDQNAREGFAASDVTEFEWANLRKVAASDQKAFDFIMSYVDKQMSEGQKFVVAGLPRSVAVRVVEVIRSYSSRARRNPSLFYASVESIPSLDQRGKNLVENRSSLFSIEITKVREPSI